MSRPQQRKRAEAFLTLHRAPRSLFCPMPGTSATFVLLRKMAREWLETGTYSSMSADTMSYSEVNRMFEHDASDGCESDVRRSDKH